MKKSLFIILAFALLVSCKKNKDSQDNGASQADMDLFKHTLTLQDQACENYVTWSQTMDSLAAITKLRQFFLSDPAVTAATIGSQGVMVQYSNGFRGGILLNYEEDTKDSSRVRNSYQEGPCGSSKLKSPATNKKMIFLDPQSSELGIYTQDLINNYNQNLPNVDYTLEVYKDEQANLDRFCHLAGYGIIQVYTHGCAWPDTENTTDVYLMTGEVVDKANFKDNKFYKEMKDGNLAYIQPSKPKFWNKTVYYMISKDFITSHNDFSKDTTLFLGNFCWSYLGSWPNIQKSFAKAAYFGYDWSCNLDQACIWSTSLMDDLCDKTIPSPETVQGWMGNSVPKSYDSWQWVTLDWKTVSIKYSGDPTLTLWKNSSTSSLWEGTLATDLSPQPQPVYCYLVVGNNLNVFTSNGDSSPPGYYLMNHFNGVIDANQTSITWNSPITGNENYYYFTFEEPWTISGNTMTGNANFCFVQNGGMDSVKIDVYHYNLTKQ